MPERISRLTSAILWLIAGITVLFALIFFLGGVIPGTEGTRYEEPKITGAFIIFAYTLLAAALLITLVFAVRSFILKPVNVRKILTGTAIAVVMAGVAMLLADNTLLDLPHYRGGDNTPRTLFLADTGLFIAYFMLGTAIALIIYSVVSHQFKK